MLLMLGISLFAVSCKKQETQNENNSMSDSAATGTMTPDNTATGGMDSTASVRDSMMNDGSGTGNQTTSPNQNGGTQNTSGTGTDSAR